MTSKNEMLQRGASKKMSKKKTVGVSRSKMRNHRGGHHRRHLKRRCCRGWELQRQKMRCHRGGAPQKTSKKKTLSKCLMYVI